MPPTTVAVFGSEMRTLSLVLNGYQAPTAILVSGSTRSERHGELVDQQIDRRRQPRRPPGQQHHVAVEMVQGLGDIVEDVVEHRDDCVLDPRIVIGDLDGPDIERLLPERETAVGEVAFDARPTAGARPALREARIPSSSVRLLARPGRRPRRRAGGRARSAAAPAGTNCWRRCLSGSDMLARLPPNFVINSSRGSDTPQALSSASMAGSTARWMTAFKTSSPAILKLSRNVCTGEMAYLPSA